MSVIGMAEVLPSTAILAQGLTHCRWCHGHLFTPYAAQRRVVCGTTCAEHYLATRNRRLML